MQLFIICNVYRFFFARKCQNCRTQYLGIEGIELWIFGYKAAVPVALFNLLAPEFYI
jgi:hypothetical protein